MSNENPFISFVVSLDTSTRNHQVKTQFQLTFRVETTVTATQIPSSGLNITKEVRLESIHKALNYLLQNINLQLGKGSIHFLHALTNFAYLKPILPEKSQKIIDELINLVRETDSEVFLSKYINKVQDKLEDIEDVDIYTHKELKIISKHVFGTVENMMELQALDIPHAQLRDKLHYYYDAFLTQNLTEWNTLLFPGFDVLGMSEWNKLITNFNFEKKNTVKMRKFYDKLTDILGKSLSLERSGFRIPGFSSELLLKIWMPEIRKVYNLFDKIAGITKQKHLSEAYESLIYVVTHFIFNACDYNLYSLKKELYMEEYQFLKKSIGFTMVTNNNDANGEVLDALMLMGGEEDPELQDIIQKNRMFLLQKQDSTGAWLMHGKPDIHAIHVAIMGLADHNYAVLGSEEFAKNTLFEDFKKRMNDIGLMKDEVEFPYDHLSDRTKSRIKGYIVESLNRESLNHLIV